ncbi:T9SS type A sorting domain-containing protein [Hymenobacter ruricola]|uniref:T9SS type A sorting domain-containing protein n=1 Tax=Hymenobacter ruricola TaxID=2791023 RepID=A0ABS0IB53_9BACT|nr:T9SS type A sorting domain-containing protein [Hymenobacter ruricola]MBF9224206.1 T9SS type A sorting domain-containing protein [Hymenobacter ruricola]
MKIFLLCSRVFKRAWAPLLAFADLGQAAQAQAPVTVTVGTGTSVASTNALLSTSTTTNKYSRTLSIYSAAELTAAGAVAGSIVSIAWFKGGTGELLNPDSQLSVYMKSTAATTLGGDPVNWANEVATATPVYSNLALAMPTGTGFKTFTLGTPFPWNGTSNLEVLVDWFRNGTPTADISWQYTAVTSSTGVHATQVGSSLLPTVRYAANRPNVQLVINRIGLASRESREASLVSLYPNPARQLLSVAVPAELTAQPVPITLLNGLGQTVHCGVLPLAGSGAAGQLDVGHLAAGLYTLRLALQNSVVTKRVTVE